ncbi:MAG: nitrate reductase cytochrome c-type subunit [Agarilytica sp.]
MNNIKTISKFSLLFLLVFGAYVFAESQIATLRKGTPLTEVNEDPAILQNSMNKDLKSVRAYPMQPPLIPHKIDNYQVDLKANKCLSCHSRDRVDESQAPMISVTHFMDRDGNFLATVSPRRYFCDQCHVVQVERDPLVESDFKDVRELMNESKNKK